MHIRFNSYLDNLLSTLNRRFFTVWPPSEPSEIYRRRLVSTHVSFAFSVRLSENHPVIPPSSSSQQGHSRTVTRGIAFVMALEQCRPGRGASVTLWLSRLDRGTRDNTTGGYTAYPCRRRRPQFSTSFAGKHCHYLADPIRFVLGALPPLPTATWPCDKQSRILTERHLNWLPFVV